jgi:CHAT domain-containing protein
MIGLAQHRMVWLQNAGLAEYRLGNFAEATRYDEEALRYALALPKGTAAIQVANLEANLALLLYERAQYQAARLHSDSALVAAQESKDDTVVAYAMLIQGMLTAHLETDERALSVLTSAWQLAPDPDIRAEIANAIANLHSRRQCDVEARLWYDRAIRTFEDKRSSIREERLRLSAFSYGDTLYRDYAEFLIRTKRQVDALRVLDGSRSRILGEGLNSASARLPIPDESRIDPRRIATSHHAIILFYSLGRKQSHLWIANADSIRLFELPSEEVIQNLVKRQQADIQQSTDPLRPSDSAAKMLYDNLIRPAADLIPANSRVIIIPDGILHGLNFETLVVASQGPARYWIEDATVTIASSIRILAISRPTAKPSTKDLLVIGDALPPLEEFAPLSSVSTEMQLVRSHFPSENLVSVEGGEAIPASYANSDPRRFRFIHFAAHGTASRLSPLESAIALSPPQQDSENFRLYGRDIVMQPINANLVTISVCYGSGIRTYPGEGLVGLAWVFLRAGSHNVIAALWQVADTASPLLMDHLYSELQAGNPPDIALRNAKLFLLHSNSAFQKPLFWGAFQLYAGL